MAKDPVKSSSNNQQLQWERSGQGQQKHESCLPKGQNEIQVFSQTLTIGYTW